MKTTTNRIYIVLAIFSLVILSCGLFTRGDDQDSNEQSAASETSAEESAAQEPDIEVSDSQESAPAADLGEQYRSPEGGFAFNVLPGYELEEFFGVVSMQAPDADPDIGPFFMLIGGSNDDAKTNSQLLEDFETGLDESGEVFDTQDIQVDSLPGIMVNFKGSPEGKDALGRVAIVAVSPTQMFSLFVVAPPEKWDDELEASFDAVLGTITFFEPEEISLDMEEVEPEEIEPVEAPDAPVQETIRQWASTATAGTEYSETDWSANQATGAPDTPDCGDRETAWAPWEGDTVDWLEVGFDTPVFASEVNIYESHTPSQIISVELIDTDGFYHEIYTAVPEMKIDCPFMLSVQVSEADYQSVGVRIIIDQSVIELPYAEIDAVEMVGLGSGGDKSAEAKTPAEDPSGAAPAGEINMPEGTLWRVSEDSLGIELGTFFDIAVSDDGRIYVPDNGNGILIFDTDGNLLDIIDHEELLNPADVKIGPDGNLYVADYFADAVLIYSPDGEFISKFGESGNGPGQFGSFGPKALAVCVDGTIYALDDNKDDNGDPFVRLIIFSEDGTYQSEVLIDEGFPVGMDCGPDSYLYVVNYFGGNIQKRDRDGNVVDEIGGEALNGTSPQYVAFDQNGGIYLTVWDEPGVVILDPAGNFLGRFGYDEDYELTPWPDGAMNQPKGIAVSADGSLIFFTDYANSQPFLEALEIR